VSDPRATVLRNSSEGNRLARRPIHRLSVPGLRGHCRRRQRRSRLPRRHRADQRRGTWRADVVRTARDDGLSQGGRDVAGRAPPRRPLRARPAM